MRWQRGVPDSIADAAFEMAATRPTRHVTAVHKANVLRLSDGLFLEETRRALIAKIGENIKVRRFVRFAVGEGLEKREDDFAAEVAAQING